MLDKAKILGDAIKRSAGCAGHVPGVVGCGIGCGIGSLSFDNDQHEDINSYSAVKIMLSSNIRIFILHHFYILVKQ